jgi:hypothetical protein
MVNKKYEYTIDGVTLKMKKLTIGASLKFDKVLSDGLDENNFNEMMEAIFPGQGTEKIDWVNHEDGMSIWMKIQKDFFFVNQEILSGRTNLVKGIASTVTDQKSKATLEKSSG